jgi:hypothetical protein
LAGIAFVEAVSVIVDPDGARSGTFSQDPATTAHANAKTPSESEQGRARASLDGRVNIEPITIVIS